MKAIYSEPKTKAMALNLSAAIWSAAICSEPEVVSEEPVTPPTDEAVQAPMF